MPAPVLIVSIVAIVVVLYGFYESLKPHFCFLGGHDWHWLYEDHNGTMTCHRCGKIVQRPKPKA